MSGANGGGGGPSKGASDLEHGVGALEKFRDRVNTLLANFESSAGGRSKVAAQTVSRTSLSGTNAGFAEADGLYTQYNRVHEALVSLSRSLGEQIEYLSLGVQAASVGFDNVDNDVRARFHAIEARLAKENGQAPHEAGSGQPRTDGSTGSAYDDLGDS
ncbi:hypothetical protein ACPXCE_13885 [Streptomyces sp. DT24]|uniref:hypothetical protein n=1 Tax=unclassified Streptomyces TaxID=2593676 RepID=UPI0023B946F1|nr:hypothetical protein [Streptomyces sp. AM 4-1-1]WEH36188.1 hypothetical protein PZB75_24230 [Streptomyces sp. AM 4-1-1]